jgi:predicted dehydrogenase
MRAGIVGAGLMGRWHAHAAARGGATVAGVADLEVGAAERLARRHRGCRTFGTVDELLRDGQVDVLHVCTPLDTHVPLVRAALRAGTHVVVEKPLSATAPETEALLDEARERRLAVCPVHQFPFQPGVRRIRELLPTLSGPHHLEVVMCSAGAVGRPGVPLDLLLMEMLPHPLSLAQALVAGGVEGVDWHARRPFPGELCVVGTAQQTDVRFFLSLSARPTECSLTVRTADATLTADLFHGFVCRERGRGTRGQKILRPFTAPFRRLGAATWNLAGRVGRWEPAYPGLRTLVRAFYAAVAAGADAPVSARDAIAVARARDRIRAGVPLFDLEGRVPPGAPPPTAPG